jgi:hypothetical protein
MNTKFADKVLRVIFIFVFVMGTVWMPIMPAHAQGQGNLSGTLHLAGSLGGWITDVAVRDDIAFIGEGLRMVILDFSDPFHPAVVGQTPPFPDIITDIQLVGNYVYATNRFGGFRIIDVSDLSNPVQVGYLPYPSFQMNNLDVIGSRAYLAAGCSGGMRVVDVADPFHPIDLGSYMTGDCTDDVVVKDGYAYVAGQSSGLYILNVTDPANILEVSRFSAAWAVYRLELLDAGANTYLYVAEGSYLEVVNVTDPANPVGVYQTGIDASVIAINGSYAYVGGGYQTNILDISQPEAPSFVGTYEHGASSIFITPTAIYLAGYPGNMHIVDTSDPANLNFISSFGRILYNFSFLPIGDISYLMDGNILNIADHTNPQIIGKFSPSGYPEVAVYGNYLYSINVDPPRFRIFNVSDPANTVLVNESTLSTYVYNICIVGDLLLRFDDADTTLRVFDLSDPASPIEIGALPLNGLGVSNIEAYNDHLAVLSTTGGIFIVDLSNPDQPQILSTYQATTNFKDVSLNSPYIYLIDGSGNLSIVNITDPSTPELVGYLGGFGDPRQISASGDFLYMVDGPSGVHVIDVSDPQHPGIIASKNISYELLSIKGIGEWVYLSTYWDGLLVLHLDNLNHSPIAEVGGPYTGIVGEPVMLNASASSDPDGDALTYNWDLDNDGQYDDATGVTTTTVFSQAGEHTVGLRVTDAFGLEDTDTATFTIADNILNPFIIVRPEDNKVFGFNWSLGTTLNVVIDDPNTIQNPDYTDSFPVVGTGSFENVLELNGIFDIQPDHVVTVSGENITRQHTVTHLAVTNINVDADTVSGTGYPGAMIHVGAICDETGCATRNINVDENGNWIADFSVPVTGHGDGGIVFDLRPGMGSSAYEFDADVDATNISWRIPNPNFDVRANYDVVEGWEWNLNSTVTIAIDDPSTPTNPDYTDTAIVGSADWDPSQTYVWFYLSGVYDIQPGDVVSMNDDSTTKTSIVTNLAITDVHPGTGIAEGVAEPNQIINLWTCWQDTCANRDETADQNGYWTTNFTTPGEQDWEKGTLDIQPGSWIDSSVEDEDGDSTMFGWYVSSGLIADAGPDQIVFAGVPFTLDASASFNSNGGALTYEWDFDNDGQYDASGVTTTTSFNQTGDHTIVLRVTDDGGLSNTDTVTITVLPWTLKGFYQPVDMNGVYNTVKGGSTVPLKFEVFAGFNELTDIAYIKSLTYAQTSCDANAITDDIETIATGGTSLRYADGQFIYNWKTPKMAGCYRVTMTTIDGSSLSAYFRLK